MKEEIHSYIIGCLTNPFEAIKINGNKGGFTIARDRDLYVYLRRVASSMLYGRPDTFLVIAKELGSTDKSFTQKSYARISSQIKVDMNFRREIEAYEENLRELIITDSKKILRQLFPEQYDYKSEPGFQTYTTFKNGCRPFDWTIFLKQSSFSEEELEAASELAENWVMCACGNQCASIPRNDIGEPLDPQLKHLGGEFSENIYLMYFYRDKEVKFNVYRFVALELIHRIEVRSIQLLFNINAK